MLTPPPSKIEPLPPVAYPEFQNGADGTGQGAAGAEWEERGRGYPLPTGGRVWGGANARKFFVFFVENTIF